MDGNIQRALWLGVSVLVFLAVVSIGMGMVQAGNNVAKEGQEKLNDIGASLSASEYASFDNAMVSGNDVISALNKYKHDSGEIQIQVTNKSGTKVNYISTGNPAAGTLAESSLSSINTAIQNSQKKNSTSSYINPFGDFYATLIYDGNEQVRGIAFEQK